MVVIDANIIIRYFVAEPKEQYEKSVEFFDKVYIGEAECEIDEVILAETIYILLKVYKASRIEIVDGINALLEYKSIGMARGGSIKEALSIFASSSIDFADALLCARSKIERVEIFSFDRDIAKCMGKVAQK